MYPIEISESQRKKLLLKTLFTRSTKLSLAAFLVVVGLIIWAGDFTPPVYWFSSTQTTTGRVLQIKKTNMNVNNVPVVRYYFEFEHKGSTYYGDSYGSWYHEIGDAVKVQYIPSNINNYARIEGTRHNTVGMLFSSIVILIIVVLCVVVVRKSGFIEMLKEDELNWLAEECRMTVAYQVDLEQRNRDGMPIDAFRITYQFEVEGEEYIYQKEAEGEAELESFGAEELLVYEEANPEECELVSEYPKPIREYLETLAY